jgi:serine/threonine-protein kinase RsbW
MASVEHPADPTLLDEMHGLLDATWEAHADVDDADRSVLSLALSEIVTNVVRHGAGATSVSIDVLVDDDAVTAVVRDDGGPLAADIVEQATWPDDALATSGRGIVMSRDALDELRYERIGTTNVWRLVRRRSDAGA